ncbi:hypothetical protein Fuma_04560 [Fuerstiella marisgermanici]|uniref:Uncharacterized protein n=1 Tax=Fuerstiella marisgermanici TaxID=1891926 RepID=A0A1P8WLH2_9PLAN|nr:hypothetical protein Fuma_04560 [Fuerstiella marisgermanici]
MNNLDTTSAAKGVKTSHSDHQLPVEGDAAESFNP